MHWVLGPFVHGRFQNIQTSEVTFAHVITLLNLHRDSCCSCSELGESAEKYYREMFTSGINNYHEIFEYRRHYIEFVTKAVLSANSEIPEERSG